MPPSFPLARDAAFAEALLLPAQKRLQASAFAQPEFKREAIVYLVRLYEAWGKSDRAAQWKAALVEKTGSQQSAAQSRRLLSKDRISNSERPSTFGRKIWRALPRPLA